MPGFVRDLLREKSGHVYVTSPSVSVRQAVRTMVDNSVGALLVIDSGEVAGIFSERDLLIRVVDEGRAPKLTRVGDVMNPEVECISPDMTIEDAIATMSEGTTRHLCVVEDGYVRGIVSLGDFLRHVTARQAEEIDSLTEYVVGRLPA